MKKTTQLRKIIYGEKTEFIMEAHNGLSAKIVEEVGFKGIWASGLTISASLGVRDNNEASWTQILEILEFMSDGTSIPILVDGDTGYGNFNNVRRLVMKLEQRNIAGVCIEDKLFPKMNSFIGGESQSLADIDEFCGKIKAAKDSQNDNDFMVVARVEAFIAGWGLDEALRRAHAYKDAGADAILIHSKKTDSSEIESFVREWKGILPVVIVPTKYYSTPTDKFREMGINLVIWANQNLRSSIDAIQKVSKRIFLDQSLVAVEDEISTVAEVFRLQGSDELEEAEKKYLPTAGKKVNSVILAAAQGDALGELTREIPKTLLKINGKTILSKQIEEFKHVGIKDITVVRGFGKEKIVQDNLSFVDNDDYATSKEVYSLFLAQSCLKENTVVSYGDIVFKSYILNELLNDDNDITIVVDADYKKDNHYHDYVKTDLPYTKNYFLNQVKLQKISPVLSNEEINGEFIGLFKVKGKGAEIVKNSLEQLRKYEKLHKARISDLFSEIIRSYPIGVIFIRGSWVDINTIVDLQRTEDFK